MRKVTQRGQTYFGVPIGTPVDRGLAAAARKRNDGKPAPRGATAMATVARKDALTKFPAAYKRPAATAETPAAGSGTVSLSQPLRPDSVRAKPPVPTKEPTVSGPVRVPVANLVWSAPVGSKIEQMIGADGTYVLSPAGSFHVLLRVSGRVRELDVSPELTEAIKLKVQAKFWP
jgi:hypothetical protein